MDDIDEAEKNAKERILRARPNAKDIVVTKAAAEMRVASGFAHPVWVVSGGFKEEEKPHTFEVIFSPDGSRLISREIH